ncbi:MAG TPA: Hsp20/alpha crystallin family protein [bacterium]|nr:Hsp20/alpha crystallin family protein [bacterium]HPP87013.1 Hsp20/alpha crystallin family protein [bacterium]
MFLTRSLFNDDFFDDLFNWDFPIQRNFSRFFNTKVFPMLNIYEDENNYYISAELPGVEKKDLKISLVGDTLSIEGKREQKEDKKKKTYYRSERVYGEFKRSISLSESIDKNKIQAELKNGVLLITLAKAEEIKPKAIEIK